MAPVSETSNRAVPSFAIPTVDISSYLTDSKSPQAQDVVGRLRDACMTSGFFQITGHGISPTLQAAVFEAAKKVFNLPLEEKVKLRGANARGYEVFGGQALQKGAKTDLKEGYFVGRDTPGAEPPYRDFQHPNKWPPIELIPDAGFKEPLVEYHKRLSALSFDLMCILGDGLTDVDTSIFTEFCTDPLANVRLLHYPPHPDDADALQFGAGAHTDFGAITLLLQDDSSGLQVLNQGTGEWIDVPPNKDAYVVNVGDMLDMWTSGKYKSNVHRVINKSGKERYSIAFFFDGNLDCVLKPLDGSEAACITVEQHMNARYAATVKT